MDSGIIGLKEFVAEHFQRFRHLFLFRHEKIPSRSKGWSGCIRLSGCLKVSEKWVRINWGRYRYKDELVFWQKQINVSSILHAIRNYACLIVLTTLRNLFPFSLNFRPWVLKYSSRRIWTLSTLSKQERRSNMYYQNPEPLQRIWLYWSKFFSCRNNTTQG